MKTGISAHWRRCLLWDLIFIEWRKIGKFFHQIMYGSHLMNSANIASAKDKPIFNITFYSIDQRLSNAIRNSARIALGKAVIAFFYWLTLSFYILDELIAKCSARHSDWALDYLNILFSGMYVGLLICIWCVAFFCCNKTACNLNTICAKFQCVGNVCWVKDTTGNNDWYFFVVLFFILFFTFNYIFDFFIIIKML